MGRREWYRSIAKGEKEGPGCISGMLQFFDFHHILFTPSSGSGNRAAAEHSSPQLQHHYSSQLKGVEAPRNSLELDEAVAAATTSTASAMAEEYNGIPIGIQLKTTVPSLPKKKKKDLLSLVEEEKRSSQCETPRTANVVARLMGLEILPDGASTPTLSLKSQDQTPRVSVKKKVMNENEKQHNFDDPRKESPSRRQPLQKRDANLLPLNVRLELGSRSLPDTPRASSERSRDADPRLSLQLNNKENNIRATYLCEVSHSLPPSPTGTSYMNINRSRRKDELKTQQDENRSPRSHYYAREIVKQVKESIHRRGSSNAGDENVARSRRMRPTDKRVLVENESKHFAAKPPSPLASSPPAQNNFFEPPKPQVRPKPPRWPLPPAPFFKVVRENVESKPTRMEASKCKRASYERFTERIRRQPPPSETATQSSDSLLKSSHVKLPSTTRKEEKNLPSCEKIKCSYTITGSNQLPSPSPQRTRPVSTVPTQEQRQQFQHRRCPKEQDPEFLYVQSILERAGILSTAQVRWYSPSLPIDPFVFHQLELDLPLFQSTAGHVQSPLRHRCNRKLLFHLVEEILVDLLSWSTNTHSTKQAARKRLHEINKELLLDRLWSQIRSFPLADCQVIDDIDVLVAGDLAEAKVRRLLGHPLVAAEVESVALEIEEDVLDSVIGEAAATLARCTKL